ncbi:hypothetical protein ACFLWO_02480 [Chloroflexota bacterium]
MKNIYDDGAGKMTGLDFNKVWVDNIPDSGIGAYKMSSIGSWDEPDTFDIGEFRLGEKGTVMRMVDGPPRSNAEVSRQTVLLTRGRG